MRLYSFSNSSSVTFANSLMNFLLFCALFCSLCSLAISKSWSEEQQLDPITVSGEAAKEEDDETKSLAPFLPAVRESRIYSGKKASETELEEIPVPPQISYRQLFSKTPGLLVSEVSNESISSINYRGLGDPHESFNMNILKDGLSINADPFGYPAVYYQPPFDSLESVEFVRGGSSLMYGPQVGGALNYHTKQPRVDSPTSFLTKQVGGSKNFWSTYNEVTTSNDGIGALGFFHRRQSDGFRDENSDFYVNNGAIKVAFDSGDDTHWLVEFDAYDADHHEAGGLALESAPGVLGYNQDRSANTLKYDHLEIERYFPSVSMTSELSSDTELRWIATGGNYRRASYRQDLGTAPAFGGIPNADTNTIQIQEFRTASTDLRLLHQWEMGGSSQQLSVGTYLLYDDSPFRQERGMTADASTGLLVKDLSRETFNAAFYAENRFVFGDLSVIPGFRLENIYQNIEEKVNFPNNDSLRSEDQTSVVPLPGVGLAYNLPANSEIYANFAKAYKPVTFQETVPLGTGDQISSDLDEANTYSYELGIRGEPITPVHFDSSVFFYDFDNQFGRVGSVYQNTGRAKYHGVDFAFEADTLGLSDILFDTSLNGSMGTLSLFSNVSFLDAEFTSGPLDGKTPQFAPDYLLRMGAVYRFPNLVKVAFLGNYVDDIFADDGNSAERYIPSYKVWDLTAEVAVYKQAQGIVKAVDLVAGINNIFDEEYYSRIRSNGIDPAPSRNYYAGVTVQF